MALSFGPLYKDFYSDLKKRREDEAAAAAQGIKLAPVGSMQWQGPRVQSAPSQSIWDKTRDIFDANSPMDKFNRYQEGKPVDNPNQSILKNIGNVANEAAKNPMVRYNPLFNPAAIQTAAYDAVRGIKPIDQTGKTAAQKKAEWDAKFGKEVDPNNPNRSYQSPLNALKQMGAEGLGNIGVGMFSVASGNTAAPSAGELTKAEADQIPGSRKITDARGNSVFVSPTNRPLTAQEEIINGINAKLAFQNPFGAKFAASLSNPVLRTGANMVAEGVQNVAANTLSNLVAPGTQSVVDRLKQSVEDAPMQFASGAPFGLLPNGGKAKAATPSVKLRTDVSTKPAAPDARAIVRGQVEAPKVETQPTTRPVVTGPSGKPVKPQVEAPDPTAALKQEALKYKSADEFVNSQINRPKPTDNVWQDTLPSGTRPDSVKKLAKSSSNTLYHDTTADGILGILDSGEIKASQAPFSSIAGQGKRVSTTRNFDNYSRYNKSPYRLVIDESKTGQRAIPDNREEFESVFRKGVSTKAVNSIAIDTTNPALLNDIRSGKLKSVIESAKKKGITIEPFEGKVLPNEGANAEVQTMTSRAFSKAFPEYKTRISQLTDLYNQAHALAKAPAPQTPKPEAPDPTAALKQEALKYKSADEFVNSQGKPVYHGSNKRIRDLPKLSTQPETNDMMGRAFYVTDSKNHGGYYARRKNGDIVNELVVTKDANIVGFDDSVSNKLRNEQSLPVWVKTNRDAYNYLKVDKGIDDPNTVFAKSGIDGFTQRLSKYDPNNQLLKEQGDSLYTAIINPNKLQTRQQLTDLYNQAHAEAKAPAPQAPKVEAPSAPVAKVIQKTQAEVPTVRSVDTPKPRVAERTAAARPVDEILYGDQPQIKERGRSVAQTLSPDRLIREKITNPLEEAAARVVQRMQTSKNPLARAAVKPLAGFSREAGVTKEVLQAKRYMRGGIEKGKLNREAIAELGDGFSRESRERVWATLDPEQAQKIGLDIPAASQLTPEEVQLQSTLKEIIDSTTEGNLRRGLITVEQADKGDYLKRGYSIFEGDAANNKAYKATRKNLLDQYKGRKEITDELIDEAITDPVYLVAKKQAESEAAWAMHDYGSFIVEKGMASPTKRPGYRQLPNNPLYGPAAGQYVPINIAEDFTGFSYDTGIINAFNDLITAYDSLGIRRAKKELLTVFNPAVRAGNQLSNRAVFANMNGINPVQFQKNYLEAGKQIKAKGQYYREAVEQGLTGIDVTQADFHARVAQYADDPNMAQKALDWTKRSYSAADDKARVAAYITWRKRGLSAEEAGRKVQRGFQDYKSVGFFYDMAAKTPLIGNAFVRFAGDAIRIAKNSALDHPLRTAATIMLWSTFVDAMSKFSGESEQDKQTREDRFGAPKIPFTDISMTVQTPMGEINVARFLPFYQLNEIQGPLARFLPIQADPTKPEGWQDPLLGQVAQLAADKDFRGKSIKDPENTGQFSEPLSPEQERMNQARFLATQNLPLGREADSIISAATGQPDIYGKERSLGQAALRAGGVKVEQFGPEQAAKQRSKNQYFDEKAKIDEQLSKMSPAEQEAYKRLTGYYKLREKVPNEFEAGAMRYKKTPVFAFPEDKWKDYTANPNIYSFMEQKKNEEAKRGVPLQPEFDKRLSLEFRKQLINNKSLAPGEDVEADERMYSNPEWDKYQQIKKEYTEKAKKYYPEKNGDFVDELVKHKTADFPQKPAAKVAYDAAYANFVAGKGPKPAFTDAVAQAKEEYTKAKLDWTNNERKARDLPPINPDVWNNVTFGFESDEEKVYKQLKYGKGYGGYGKGGSRKVSMKNIYGYGSGLTPRKAKAQTVKKIAAPKVKVASSKTTKPKVTIKKSKV